MFRFPPRATRPGNGRPDRHHPALVARLEHLSFEVFPSPKLLEHARSLPPGARVSVTSSPKSGITATLDAAATLLQLGHPVVPHLAARMVGAGIDITSVTNWLESRGVRDVLVIGGDASPPRGPYRDARACIEALLTSDLLLDGVGLGG
jgi:methylenetetrahydrofolate reductase (NADPH)